MGLRIYDHKQVDRSQWGPIGGEPDKEEIAATKPFRFGSDDENNNTPEDRDKYIPPNDKAELTEEQIAELACLFPTTATIKPKVLPLDAFPMLVTKCHQLCLLPLTFQQAYWPELLELEYPEELQSQWDQQAPSSDELWDENQVDYLLGLPMCLEEILEEFRLELHHLLVEAVEEPLEEGEIQEPLKEGEIHLNRHP